MAGIKISGKNNLTPDQLAKEIEKALHNAGKMARARLLMPTSTWSHGVGFSVNPPVKKGDDLVCDVITNDAPYFFLDGGTSVRYATMDDPFEAKTVPKSFAARPGIGGLNYVSRRRPRPGIEAREWTRLAALEFGPILQSALNQILANYTPKMPASTKAIHASDWKPPETEQE